METSNKELTLQLAATIMQGVIATNPRPEAPDKALMFRQHWSAAQNEAFYNEAINKYVHNLKAYSDYVATASYELALALEHVSAKY